jgi:UDPglucose--hexose-1-phosphate uridylyltransferase
MKIHRRYNPLINEWVLVSPHRAETSLAGSKRKITSDSLEYDPTCYLCPGNLRANGK